MVVTDITCTIVYSVYSCNTSVRRAKLSNLDYVHLSFKHIWSPFPNCFISNIILTSQGPFVVTNSSKESGSNQYWLKWRLSVSCLAFYCFIIVMLKLRAFWGLFVNTQNIDTVCTYLENPYKLLQTISEKCKLSTFWAKKIRRTTHGFL